MVGLLGFLLIASIGYFTMFTPTFFKFKRFSLAKYKHIQKEKKLLASIIKDIKKHPDHWVKNGYCPMTLRTPILVNDYSSIGISYGERTDIPDIVLIHFNIKNLTKFDQKDENSVVTRIEGRHVKKFINTLTTILDVRGKELDFFSAQLKERL